MNSIFSRVLLLTAGFFLLISCDKEVNDIGASVLGEDNYGFETYTNAGLVAFTQKTNAVQTNNNLINQLGVYDNLVFGKTLASFVSQLQLETLNPVIINESDVNITLDIPFLNPTILSTTTTAPVSSTYDLQNIVGNKTSKIKLSVYRISREFSKSDEKKNGEAQRYYSDDDIDSKIVGVRLNDGPATNNDEVVLDQSEKSLTTNIITTTNGTASLVSTTVAVPPTIRLKLNASLLAILKASNSTNLATQFDFSQFFRGIYIKAEQSGTNEGYLTLLDFKQAKIRIAYKGAVSSTDPTILQKPDIILGFGSVQAPVISINLLQQINKSSYNNALSNPNKIIGDEKIFLKGGNGSVAIINLFGQDLYGVDGISGTPNQIADELDILKSKNWLINEANLVFHVDQAAADLLSVDNKNIPLRISLYDTKNNLSIIDFVNDISSDKSVFDGAYNKTKSIYKVRVTNYIRNLIENGDKNITLGVFVSQSLNNSTFGANSIYNGLTYEAIRGLGFSKEYYANFFPNNSIVNPLGTVLSGNTTGVPADKKLKLEIIYSKVK